MDFITFLKNKNKRKPTFEPQPLHQELYIPEHLPKEEKEKEDKPLVIIIEL